MRYLDIELTNYIGIYNGMRLNNIRIDFRNGKNRLVVIKGDNGSGKSTLFNAISILPDDNNQFIPGMEASKKITIYDDYTGTEYAVCFIHGIKRNGERDTTKGYISKLINGVWKEMNPNGNISSYRDYVYSEFQLDSNFLALSQLSSEDRGLVDKKPSERKRFVTSIINTLEVYNGMYKILTKKSSLYKSMINSITSKLNSIGDPAILQANLTSISNRIESLMRDKDVLSNKISDGKSMIKLLDPDGNIRNEYNIIYNEMKFIDSQIESVLNKINRIGIDIDKEDVKEELSKVSKEITRLETVSISTQEIITNLIREQDEKFKSINSKTERLNSISSDRNRVYYEDIIKTYTENITNQEYILSNMGLLNSNMTKDEFILGLNILDNIRQSILSLQDRYPYDIIDRAISVYIPDGTYPDVDTIQDQIDNLEQIIEGDRVLLRGYLDIERSTYILQDRPMECKIDTCPFIDKALEVLNTGVVDMIPEIQYRVDSNTEILNVLKSELEMSKLVVESINIINSFLKQLSSYTAVLAKLPNGLEYIDRERILKRIRSGDQFQDIANLYSYVDSANILEEYRKNKDYLDKIKSEYDIFLSRESIVKEISTEIEDLNARLNEISNILNDYRATLSNIQDSILEASNIEIQLSNLSKLYDELDTIMTSKNNLKDRLAKIDESIIKIKEVTDTISLDQQQLELIDRQISPLVQERENIVYNIRVSEEYVKELEEYRKNYEKIETVKYYTSPSTGIQTIFMELYMHKILSMANDLLTRVFNGQFVLQPFVINENEFRIPCLGQGLINDDISSMSTSQKCMISMILSFSLLVHSSSKYNVLKIDEIDGGLDTTNRINFINLLEHLMNVVGCQQCIMISHNSEIDLSNADLIVLRDEAKEFMYGNIIYRYNG